MAGVTRLRCRPGRSLAGAGRDHVTSGAGLILCGVMCQNTISVTNNKLEIYHSVKLISCRNAVPLIKQSTKGKCLSNYISFIVYYNIRVAFP